MSDVPDTCPVFDGGNTIGYGSFCHHEERHLDRTTRKVNCKKCGGILDPFDVLAGYASGEIRAKNLEEEIRERHTKIKALRAEEVRIKARTRTARKKDAEDAVARERTKRFKDVERALWMLRETEALVRDLRKKFEELVPRESA